MNYLTVCSGSEAFGEAWKAMGYVCKGHSEIEPNASAVLRYRYPETPNHGDFTKINTDDYPPGFIQLLAGGTPCQSFSVAGLRGGMEDARGNLTLEFLKLADRLKCPWILWENVPGVLSSNGGRDFGSFLGGLAQLGYGFAYRILDAQYFGVPQRRKRVFVVGYLGDWRVAAAVLFERHSLQGNPAPRRQTGERLTDTLTVGANQCSGFPGDFDEVTGGLNPDCSPAPSARDCKGPSSDGTGDGAPLIVTAPTSFAASGHGGYVEGVGTLRSTDGDQGYGSENIIAHTLRGEGFDASEDGTGRGVPLVAGTITSKSKGSGGGFSTDFYASGGLIPEITGTLSNNGKAAGSATQQDAENNLIIPETVGTVNTRTSRSVGADDAANGHIIPVEQYQQTCGCGHSFVGYLSQRCPACGFIRDGVADGEPMPFNTTNITSPENRSNPKQGDPCHTLGATDHPPAIAYNITPSNSNKDFNARESERAQAITASGNRPSARGGDVVAFGWQNSATQGDSVSEDVTPTLDKSKTPAIQQSMAVRRLTPKECERLQGWEDDWTRYGINAKGKQIELSDSARYRIIGNGWAAPVANWIAERMKKVNDSL